MSTLLRANGKLLLTGEYFILDGTAGLAVPTRPGQTLRLERSGPDAGDVLRWIARDHYGMPWLTETFYPPEWRKGARTQVQGEDKRARVLQLLSAAEELRPGCTASLAGAAVTTDLAFDRRWGLGSSSTLVANLARLLDVDPYALLERTFGGSGYDLACAVATGPILYQRNGTTPHVTPLDWRPDWLGQTYFVYRNQKQNSRAGIRAYRRANASAAAHRAIGAHTLALLNPTLHLRSAAQILHEHEAIVAETLGLTPVQQEIFPDFPGLIKSLGAWGGDFVWALSEEPAEKVRAYFNERGYPTVIPYDGMVR